MAYLDMVEWDKEYCVSTAGLLAVLLQLWQSKSTETEGVP